MEYRGGVSMAVQKCAGKEEICKQPNETYLFGVDYSQVLEEGEYILVGTSTITAVDNEGNDATSDVLDNTDKVVQTADEDDISVTPITNGMLATRIKGGTEALSKYKLTYLAQTSNENTYEKDVLMRIKDN